MQNTVLHEHAQVFTVNDERNSRDIASPIWKREQCEAKLIATTFYLEVGP